MNKLRVRTVLEVFYRVQAERLARMIDNSEVCSE